MFFISSISINLASFLLCFGGVAFSAALYGTSISLLACSSISSGLTGYFEKGHIPQNKGKKMSEEMYKKCAPTMFKKGNIPFNYREVGSERVTRDGYIEIKVDNRNRWKLKHIIIWEKEFGPIPKHHCIIFLDGNKQNFDLKNLKLISRNEHARLQV